MSSPQTLAVLGTGEVGRALAGAFTDLGYVVVVGTRDLETTLARADYTEWLAVRPGLGTATYADAAAAADVVINATSGVATLDVLAGAGAANLADKVLVDVANPLDFSQGMPPRLSVSNDDSLGEQVQRAFPEARVVKALNTMNNAVMVDPHRLEESTTAFVCGDDAEAKAVVIALIADLGHDDVIDLGPLTSARGVEMILPLYVALSVALDGADLNFKIVRATS